MCGCERVGVGVNVWGVNVWGAVATQAGRCQERRTRRGRQKGRGPLDEMGLGSLAQSCENLLDTVRCVATRAMVPGHCDGSVVNAGDGPG
jgi:hypothetical protein